MSKSYGTTKAGLARAVRDAVEGVNNAEAFVRVAMAAYVSAAMDRDGFDQDVTFGEVVDIAHKAGSQRSAGDLRNAAKAGTYLSDLLDRFTGPTIADRFGRLVWDNDAGLARDAVREWLGRQPVGSVTKTAADAVKQRIEAAAKAKDATVEDCVEAADVEPEPEPEPETVVDAEPEASVPDAASIEAALGVLEAAVDFGTADPERLRALAVKLADVAGECETARLQALQAGA